MEDTPRSERNARRFYWVILGLVLGSLVGLNILGVRDQALDGVGTGSGMPIHTTPAMNVAVAVLFMAGLLGFGLAVRFLVNDAKELKSAARPRIQPAVLLISFIVFLVSMVILDLFAAVIGLLLGIDVVGETGNVVVLLLQMLSRVGAFALGIATLRWLTSYTCEDPREIGWRVPWPLDRIIAWGVGGYCAALPFMLVALLIWQRLGATLLKHVKTPEHPITPLVNESAVTFALAFVLAVVIAPIVEETFFRGMLYNALRANMGVWPAAFASGAMFSIIHPTMPAGFLPIMFLGAVLAILREKTGSLLPSMICHALNNAAALILVKLVF